MVSKIWSDMDTLGHYPSYERSVQGHVHENELEIVHCHLVRVSSSACSKIKDGFFLKLLGS
jgi:hypothetical protein